MNNKIVFTDYCVVVKLTDNSSTTIQANKYLQDLEKQLGNDKYGVFYSTTKKAFYITDDGVDYDVVLTGKDEECLNTEKYTPLVNNLLYLAGKHRRLCNENNAKLVRETKILAMENSNYEDIEDVEDLKLYIDYLKNTAYKKAKTREEKETIQTKMVGIRLLIKRKEREDDSRIPSPLDLKSYLEKFVYSVTNRVNRLDRSEKIKILDKTKKIVQDYKKLNDINQGRRIALFGSGNLANNILDRIDEIEDYLDRKLSPEHNPLTNELNQIMGELEEFVDDKNHGAK